MTDSPPVAGIKLEPDGNMIISDTNYVVIGYIHSDMAMAEPDYFLLFGHGVILLRHVDSDTHYLLHDFKDLVREPTPSAVPDEGKSKVSISLPTYTLREIDAMVSPRSADWKDRSAVVRTLVTDALDARFRGKEIVAGNTAGS